MATALAGLLTVATPLAGGSIAAGNARALIRLDAAPSVTSDVVDATIRSDASPADDRADRPESAGDADAATSNADPPRRRPPELLVRVPDGGLVARRNPTATAAVVGRVRDRSRYYGVPTVAWVEEVTDDGRWGRVELPYAWPRREGWIRLDGLRSDTTHVRVKVDLSEHRLTVRKRGEVRFRAPVATGRASSPTPPGEYFVTDRVPFASGSAFGSFAFGISGIQPRLPAGWTGGDQLAIHGTDAPWTIGTSASAGCVRVSEATLAKLKPLLRLGTPVVIVR